MRGIITISNLCDSLAMYVLCTRLWYLLRSLSPSPIMHPNGISVCFAASSNFDPSIPFRHLFGIIYFSANGVVVCGYICRGVAMTSNGPQDSVVFASRLSVQFESKPFSSSFPSHLIADISYSGVRLKAESSTNSSYYSAVLSDAPKTP